MKAPHILIGLLAIFLTSCGCKEGYGPNDCDVAWADHYTGTWQVHYSCWGNGDPISNTANATIDKLSPTRFRIDGTITADLSEWNEFSIPAQSVQGNTVSGFGRLVEHPNIQNGIQVGSRYTITISMNVIGNGGSAQCTWSME